MSNKFSHTTQTQKPPHICHKPPPGPPYDLPPFELQSFCGYVEYFNPQSPAEGGMTSPINLLPAGPPFTWFGMAIGNEFIIHLLMLSNFEQTMLAFRFDFWTAGVKEPTVIVQNLSPRSWQPFDSGTIQPLPQPEHGKLAWRIWT